MLKPLIAVCIAVIFLTVSCKRENTYWDADIVAPLAKSTLNLSSIFPDSILKSNSDSSLKIAFEAEMLNFKADSLLKVPDTSLNSYYSPIVWPGGYYAYQPSDIFPIGTPNTDLEFAISSVELNRIKILSGKMKVKVESVMRQPTFFNCVLSSATKNGQVLSLNIPTPAATYLPNDTIPGTADTLVDLSGYDIDMAGLSGNKTNTIYYTLKLIIAPYALADTLRMGDYIKTNIAFMQVIPQYGQGYFGNQTINIGPDTTLFDVFNKIKSGNLHLSNATMQLKVINDFGVDMKAKINQVVSINSSTGLNKPLTSSVLNSSFNVNRATKTGLPSPLINPTTKTLTLNQNSNLVDFLNNIPDKISYALTAQLNPNGNQSGMNDFAYYGTSLRALLNVDIPLNFSASNLSLQDTVDFNYSHVTQLDNVNYGNLLLYATNTYPLSVNVQGYLLDENGARIDSLFSNPVYSLIAPADLDANNKVTGPKKSELRIPLNKEKLVNIKKARKVYFVSRFNTANQPTPLKFYNYYSLDLLLTMDVNYSVNK